MYGRSFAGRQRDHKDGSWQARTGEPRGGTTMKPGIGELPATRLSRIVAACVLLIAPAGCMGVSVHDAPFTECG